MWNYCLANFIALIVPDSSTCRALPTLVFSPKHKRKFESWFLKIHPQAEDWLVEDLSMLHLTHWGIGGLQMTSMILEALGGWRVTLSFFMMTKFEMLAKATTFERFPIKAVFEIRDKGLI